MTTKKAPSPPELLELPLSKISGIDPANPRKTASKAADTELDASIAVLGVLQPIGVRPDPAAEGMFLVVYGQRRYNSSVRVGRETILAMPREIAPGDDLAEVALTENIQRAPMDPVDEIFAIADLLKRLTGDGQSLPLAVRYASQALGKPISYIQKRSLAAKLPKGILAKIRSVDSPFRGRGIESILLFAQLPIQEQKDLLERSWFRADPHELREMVRSNSLALDGAPFETTEKTIPGVPACVNCPSNTANTPGLFGECDADETAKPGAVCRDSQCYESKLGDWLEAVVAEARKKHGSALVLIDGTYDPSLPRPKTELKSQMGSWEITPAKKATKGSRPAMPISGKGLGRIRWIAPAKSSSGAPSPTSVPAAERTPAQDLDAKVERLVHRRRNAFAERVRELLQERLLEGKAPTAANLVRWVLAYGTRRLEHYDFARRAKILDPEFDARESLVKELLPEIDASMKPTMIHRFEDAFLVARLILRLDPKDLEDEIAEAIPESAALQKLREQVKAAKPAKKKAKRKSKKKATAKK